MREALGRRATLEAPARARAAAEAAARERPIAPPPGKRRRARTEKQRAYERRRRQERTRKQKRAAKLLEEMTQQQAVAELGVSSRTLRNWQASVSVLVMSSSGGRATRFLFCLLAIVRL